MRVYVCNALAIGMLSRDVQSRDERYRATRGTPRTPRPLSLYEARCLVHDHRVEVVPAVGHADTARVIADLLGLKVEQVYSRTTVRLQGGPDDPWDTAELALIGAYVGPRLPEGATSLPEGASIEWWTI